MYNGLVDASFFRFIGFYVDLRISVMNIMYSMQSELNSHLVLRFLTETHLQLPL